MLKRALSREGLEVENLGSKIKILKRDGSSFAELQIDSL